MAQLQLTEIPRQSAVRMRPVPARDVARGTTLANFVPRSSVPLAPPPAALVEGDGLL